MKLKPFFTFYGGKWRAAPHYPEPDYATIVEPFCGSAGYSVRYPDRKIILVDKDPVIAATWKYLIRVTPKEILQLPDIQIDQTVDDLGVCEEARYLIGWWLNGGSAQPKKSPGSWMRKTIEYGGTGWVTGGGQLSWGERVRQRIASQIEYIRHWTFIESTYEDAPDIEATWFIDPPYIEAGKYYRYNSHGIDYAHLGQWCKERKGQVMVCENVGANWLPFDYFRDIQANVSKHGSKISKEAIWQNHTNPPPDISSLLVNEG